MPVSERIKRERQARYDARMEAAKDIVPEGLYCYRHTGEMRTVTLPDGQQASVPKFEPCPFLKHNPRKPRQRNGYCRLLKAGDWMPHPHGTMLLWDSVKECGINTGDDQD